MSEALVERLNAAEIALRDDRPYAAVAIGEAADRIEAIEREVKELRAEAREHKRLKNELVLKAYPAMDDIDEIAEGFRSAVHFVRNNAMNMERDYPEICHAEEVFSRARAALSGSSSGWRAMDSAPKDRLVLLAAEFIPGDWRIKVGGWREDWGRWEIFGASWTPTHWMPLPAAPQQEGE